jgi:NADH dehydrogenase
MSILIVGGTGRVGREVALTLSKRGFNVTAMLRGGRNHTGSEQLLNAGVNVVEGDLRSPMSLSNAVQSVETVFCSATSMPSAANDGLRQVDHDGTLSLIEAAEKQGVKRFIYISYSGNIRFDSPLECAKRDCENRLIRSRMETLILRPSYFMDMWLGPMLGFDPANGSVRIYGSGNAKVSYISSSNVADFAVASVTAPAGEKNVILELGGPEPLSQLEAVRIFEQTLGKQMRIDYVPVETLRAQHESSDPLARTFGALMLSYAKGDEVPNAVEAARQFQILLRSVSEHASSLASQISVA